MHFYNEIKQIADEQEVELHILSVCRRDYQIEEKTIG